MIESPDERVAQLFPLTDRNAFAKKATRQILAANRLWERSFDSHTAEQWRDIGGIFNHLRREWRLDWCATP